MTRVGNAHTEVKKCKCTCRRLLLFHHDLRGLSLSAMAHKALQTGGHSRVTFIASCGLPCQSCKPFMKWRWHRPVQPAACVSICCHCYSNTGFTWSQAGGRVVEMVIKDRSHLGSLLFDEGSRQPHRLDCDILINCTGLHGARDIFGDESVYPIRGQVGANVDDDFY